MKQNMVFTDFSIDDEQSAASLANLQKIQHGLLMGLGAVLTYFIMALSVADPFFDNLAPVFLWLMLLFAPAAAGLVVYKFPAWKAIPLTLRKQVILNAFSLSVLTLSTTVVFSFQWHPYEAGFWVISALATLVYGAGVIWLAFRLQRQIEEERGELFP